MTGGLLQLITVNNHDVYLTGNPEITFFKTLYRRHTHFAIESKVVHFDNDVRLGTDISCCIPKIGDLMTKIYVEIVLPEIHFKRCILPNPEIAQADYNNALAGYNILQAFIELNRSLFVTICDLLLPENVEDIINIIKLEIQTVFSAPANQTIINNYKTFILTASNIYNYTSTSIESFIDTTITDKDQVKIFIQDIMTRLSKLQFDINCDVVCKHKILLDALDPFLKFAWVKKLGHAIIEEVYIDVGGTIIDRHYGDWLNIWHELTGHNSLENIYDKMIGNIPILTSFDRNKKPQYKIRIPLQFWFCRFNFLAFPLIALQYQDVIIHVKLRRFELISYIEDGNFIKIDNNANQFFLDEIVEVLNIPFEANLLIDYIYLDSYERKQFALSSHDYLIDQLNVQEFCGITQDKIQFILDKFNHPTKELIFVSQKDRYVTNPTGYNECMWYNYSMFDNNTSNPIYTFQMQFDSYERVNKISGNYTNYVQPYESHYRTPSDGINMYSFSLFPEEFQPSGSANFSVISKVNVELELNTCMICEDCIQNTITIRFYTRNINILRFASGIAGLAFVTQL